MPSMISTGWAAMAARAKWWPIWTAPILPAAAACAPVMWLSTKRTENETDAPGDFVSGLDRHDGGGFRRCGLRPGILGGAEDGGGAAGIDGGGADVPRGRGL